MNAIIRGIENLRKRGIFEMKGKLNLPKKVSDRVPDVPLEGESKEEGERRIANVGREVADILTDKVYRSKLNFSSYADAILEIESIHEIYGGDFAYDIVYCLADMLSVKCKNLMDENVHWDSFYEKEFFMDGFCDEAEWIIDAEVRCGEIRNNCDM